MSLTHHAVAAVEPQTSRLCLPVAMMSRPSANRRSARTATGRRAGELRRSVGHQIVQLRGDAGLSQRRVAHAAGVPQAHLSRIERGHTEASLSVLVSIGATLGADLAVRFYPGTGPRLRDRLQAPMVEALLGILDRSWRRSAEVPVWRPVRAVIDLVIARPGEIAIAVEVHSEIRRLEQQLRWAAEKAAALPSSNDWTLLTAGEPSLPVSRLLVLRNTKANRDLVRAFAETLAAAYPARTGDVAAALRDPRRPWPGDAVLWADVAGGTARILDRAPRGVSLGR